MWEPDDDFLDAFSDEDFRDPDLGAFDHSVKAILDGLREQPSAGRRRLGTAALIAAGVCLGYILSNLGTAPPLAPETAGNLESVTPPPMMERPAPPPLMDDPPTPELPDSLPRRVASAPPSPTPPSPPREPGLLPHLGADLRIVDGHALLSAGILTFARDERRDPGVEDVRWSDLPIAAIPLGTVFHAAAGDAVAAIKVVEHRVRVAHVAGPALLDLEEGQEAVAVLDPIATLGVRAWDTTHMTLAEVRESVPVACGCAAEVVKTVAQLRYVPMPDVPEVVPPLGDLLAPR